MQNLTYEQLKQAEAGDKRIPLINVLPAEKFAKTQIPGAVSIPGDSTNFAAEVEQLAGGKDKEVIVYCASNQCDASKKAAEKLEQAGFTDVKCYEGGAKEWQEKSGTRQAA